MPKVRVIGPVDGDIHDALLKLLVEAGLEVLEGDPPADAEDECGPLDAVDNDAQGTAEGLPEAENLSEDALPPCEEDAGIVVLSPGALGDGSIEAAMRRAAARGCHVIGVWPPGTPEGSLPRPFEDYGGDTTVWDPGRLRDIIARPQAPPSWSLPDDRPRPERPVKRHKC